MKKLSAAIVAILLGSTAAAADFRVTRFDDPAPNGCTALDCSVREAVIAANAAAGADRVVLRTGTYSLTRVDTTPDTYQVDLGPLWVTSAISFVGAGEGATLLRWNTGIGHPGTHANRVIYAFLATSNPGVVEISSMTISHGRGAQGGCVRMEGIGSTLRLNRAVLQSCYSPSGGGALYVHNAALNLDQVTVRSNGAYHGGAMQIIGTVSVTSRNTLITNNTADYNAGAVYIYGNALAGLLTTVNWVDNGGTVIENNVAAGAGGAIQVKDTAHLNLSSASTVAPADWLVLRANIAGGVGGAIHNAPPLGPNNYSVIQRVRLLENQASDGGAIATSSAMTLVDAEIAGNRAETGVGGGIAFMGTLDWAPGRSLARVSLRANYAATGGGGIHSSCLPFTAENVSLHLNDAGGPGRGQAIETEGSATLRHLTLYSNTSSANPGAPGLYKRYTTACPDTSVRVANSLIGDYCAAPNGGLFSDGGNQLGPFAINCPALQTIDQRQSTNTVFKLGFGAYGGPFVLVGWTADLQTRPQRNFGLASYCTSIDARGIARADGLCDAGAFEQ